MPRLDRYQDPDTYDILASEYVLGTMRGRARQRFQQLVSERPYIQQAVEAWERRLNPLAERTTPVQPPARVWCNIKREIEAVGSGREKSSRFWDNILLWRATTVAALLLVAALMISQIPSEFSKPITPSFVSVLKNEDNEPMFVATGSKQPMRLTVMMADHVSVSPEQDLELWCVMKGKVWSIGVLQRAKETTIMLTQDHWDMLDETVELAISAEPKGGSPTGTPTGPVMYAGDVLLLI